MAKKFLSYGLTKGLSYREDWDKVLGRALQSEALDRQAQQIREEKVRYYADKVTKAHVIGEKHMKEYDEFCKDLNKQVADFPINHPGWESNLDLHMQFNQLTDQYLNNHIVIKDKKVALEWEKFRQASPNLLEKEIEENIKAYDDYNEGVTDTPYTFYAPKHFDYTPHVQNAVELIMRSPEQFMVPDKTGDIYGTGATWNIERLRDVARGLIIDNPDEYERKFKGIKQMGFDYANEEEWITSLIESYLGPGGVQVKGRYGRGTGTGTGTQGSFYLNSIKLRDSSTNDDKIHHLVPKSVDTEKNIWLEPRHEGHVMLIGHTEDFVPELPPEPSGFVGPPEFDPASQQKVPKENRLPFRIKSNQSMIERISPAWKTLDDGRKYARARMKMTPEMFEDLGLKDKLKSIGLPYELVEEKMSEADKQARLVSMYIQGMMEPSREEEGIGKQIAQAYT